MPCANTFGQVGAFKPDRAPDSVRSVAPKEVHADRAFLNDLSSSLPKEPPAGAFIYPMVVRHSDEDINRHANHSKYGTFFEDAKNSLAESKHPLAGVAARDLTTISVEYNKEARAGELCEIHVSQSDGRPDELDFHMIRVSGGAEGIITRGKAVVPPAAGAKL